MSNLRGKTTQVKEDISITRKLKFEKLVSSISSRFVGNYKLDKVINKSLADMGEFIHASRVFIFLFNIEKPYMINTHEWCNMNAESHINDYKHLQMNEVPWVIKQLLKGNPLIIEDVSRLPPEAKNIKNLLKNHRVKSNLTIPLYINGEIGGFIGFDDDLESRNWVEEDLNLLQISSRIIGNAIERKLTEDILKESEKRYRELFNTMSMGVAVYNAINNGEEFVFKDFNLAAQKIENLKKKEVIGKKITKIFPGIKEFGVFKVIQRVWKTGEPIYHPISLYQDERIAGWRENYVYKLPSGEIVTIYNDLTEKAEIEQKLKESEEKYKSVLENITEGYFEVDLEGNFIFFNDALCKSSGYSREELLNKSYSMVFDEETKEKIFRVYNDLYKKGEGFTLIEYQILKKNGMRTYHESSVYLRYSSDGDIIGFKGFVRDISERKKAEALRKQFSRELEKEVELRTKELKVALDHQKLYLDQIIKASQFKTEFMATMSHELRTPLNAIIGFTDLILEGVYGKLNSEQLEYIKDIEESSKHLLDMITHILDISKIESGQVTVTIDKIQLSNIIEQVISTLKPLFSKKNLKVEIRGLRKKQIIYADSVKLKQIIYNLLSNAIKFTERGIVSIEFLDKKDNWVFHVKDTGIGIAEKDYDIIFKDFKRVKSPYVDSMPGSGLGLSLTKRIIQLHGGEISFTSKIGKGTTFSFYIPKKIKNINSRLRVESLLKCI